MDHLLNGFQFESQQNSILPPRLTNLDHETKTSTDNAKSVYSVPAQHEVGDMGKVEGHVTRASQQEPLPEGNCRESYCLSTKCRLYFKL